MKQEQKEYETEGIQWRNIDFKDNDSVINLITKVSFIFIFLHLLLSYFYFSKTTYNYENQ